MSEKERLSMSKQREAKHVREREAISMSAVAEARTQPISQLKHVIEAHLLLSWYIYTHTSIYIYTYPSVLIVAG